MEQIILGNGNVLYYEKPYYGYGGKSLTKDLQKDISMMSPISILNIKEKRLEKTKYLISDEHTEFNFGNKNYIFIYNDKNKGVNVMSLSDGSIIFENDILNINKVGFYGFPFLESNNGEVFYISLSFNLEKLPQNEVNFRGIINGISNRKNIYNISDYLYNFSDNKFYLKKDYKIKENECPVYSDNNLLLCLEPQSRFYVLYNRSNNSKRVKEKILFFSPYNKQLDFGIIVFSNKIMKYDLFGNTIILDTPNMERKNKINDTLYNSYFEVGNDFKFINIDENILLNIVDNKFYTEIKKYDKIGCFKNLENGKDILIDSTGIISIGEMLKRSRKFNLFQNEENEYFIFGDKIDFQKFNVNGIEDIEILNIENNHYDGVNVLMYSKTTNKLYLGNTGGFNNKKEIYGCMELIELPGLGSEYFKYLDFKKDNILEIKFVSNFITLYCNIKYTCRKNLFFSLEGEKLVFFGEETIEKDDKEVDGKTFIGLQDKIFVLNSEKKYGVIKNFSTKDLNLNGFSYVRKRGKYFIMKYSDKILITKENIEGNFEIIYNEEIISEKYSYNPNYIVCDKKYKDTKIYFSSMYWILKKSNTLIFLNLDDDNIYELPNNISYKIDSNNDIILNLVDRLNKDFYSPIENLENIKYLENFKSYKKVIQINKKEYLMNGNFEKITKKDYTKILTITDKNLLLVKQSGFTYLSDFDGNIIGEKYKKIIPIIEDYEYYKKQYKEEEIKLKNNYFLCSLDDLNFYLYNDNFDKISLTDENNNEIILSGVFEGVKTSYSTIINGIDGNIILGTKTNKKITLNLLEPKFENKILFDDIEIYENLTFKGCLGRDVYHFNALTEKQLYSENYYDIKGGIRDFLIVEDRRDYVLLDKTTGLPVNNKTYKEFSSDYYDNLIKVIDFENNTLFVNKLGDEFISVTGNYVLEGNNYGVLKGGKQIKNIKSGENIFLSDKNILNIELGAMYNENSGGKGTLLILEFEDKSCSLIDSRGNLILVNKKKIQIIENTQKDIHPYLYIFAKDGKEKYSIFDLNGNLLDKEIFTDINYVYDNGKVIKGEISGADIIYNIDTQKITIC